jgi:hypothetical protein
MIDFEEDRFLSHLVARLDLIITINTGQQQVSKLPTQKACEMVSLALLASC